VRVGVLDQASQGHPVVPVEGLGSAGAGRGIMVPAGAFDLRAMPLGGSVVQRRGETLADRDVLNGQIQEGQSQFLDLEPECGEGVIIGAIAASDAGGAEPTGDRASPLREDDADDQTLEPPGVSAVEMLGEGANPAGEQTREHDASHPSSSWGIVT
jgi:hypothetical protein